MERKHTKEEETARRMRNFEGHRDRLLREGHTEQAGTVTPLKANLLAPLYSLPFLIAVVFVYLLIWPLGQNVAITPASWRDLVLACVLFMLSIPLHEFLHGFVWHFFCEGGWAGVRWKLLTPCCHCLEPVSYRGYLLALTAPFLVLGILVAVLAVLFHSHCLLLLSCLGIIGAGGDILVAYRAIAYPSALFLDHPTQCGFSAFIK